MTLITVSRVVENLAQLDEVKDEKTNDNHRNSSKKPMGGKTSDWASSDVDSWLFSGSFSSGLLLKKRCECLVSILLSGVLEREPGI